MDKKMKTTEKKHPNGTKIIYRQLLKQWSEQTTQKLPNKGPQTVQILTRSLTNSMAQKTVKFLKN